MLTKLKKTCGSFFILPGDTRWNGEWDSCNDCVKKIDNSPDQLESLMTYLKLKKFTDAEIRGLKEYVRVMEPIALALDFIQGDQVHLGHLLPLIVKTGNNIKIIMKEIHFFLLAADAHLSPKSAGKAPLFDRLVSLCGKNPQNNGSAVYENLAYFSEQN